MSPYYIKEYARALLDRLLDAYNYSATIGRAGVRAEDTNGVGYYLHQLAGEGVPLSDLSVEAVGDRLTVRCNGGDPFLSYRTDNAAHLAAQLNGILRPIAALVIHGFRFQRIDNCVIYAITLYEGLRDGQLPSTLRSYRDELRGFVAELVDAGATLAVQLQTVYGATRTVLVATWTVDGADFAVRSSAEAYSDRGEAYAVSVAQLLNETIAVVTAANQTEGSKA